MNHPKVWKFLGPTELKGTTFLKRKLVEIVNFEIAANFFVAILYNVDHFMNISIKNMLLQYQFRKKYISDPEFSSVCAATLLCLTNVRSIREKFIFLIIDVAFYQRSNITYV